MKDECCPKFDPKPWESREFVWKDKMFIMDSIPQFMHMPIFGGIDKVMTKLWNKAEESKAKPDNKDFLVLAYDPSPWKCEFYMTVTKEVSGIENAKISGTFVTKVFDGPYNDVPKWIKVMDKYLEGKEQKAIKYYFYYTTCPKCAEKYGHNYVVVFAQVK